MVAARMASEFRDVLTREECAAELGGGRSLALGGEHTLTVDAHAGLLHIKRADGVPTLTIRITEGGPVLSFHDSLQIQAAGIVGIEGQTVAIRGREGVQIESGGNTSIVAKGDFSSVADAQSIRARLGDVEVKANDDVRLRGERIKLNC